MFLHQLPAKILYQHEQVPKTGFFYPPTIMASVEKGMPVLDEETFGPVAVLLASHSDENALAMANDTPYGLGASVWTSERGDYFAEGLDVGTVYINGVVSSSPELPFGGCKQSGFGRELGVEGLTTFSNIKISKRGNLG